MLLYFSCQSANVSSMTHARLTCDGILRFKMAPGNKRDKVLPSATAGWRRNAAPSKRCGHLHETHVPPQQNVIIIELY